MKYNVIVFCKIHQPLKYRVTNLKKFQNWLSSHFSDWKYINVYNASTRIYMKRVYNNK